MEVRYEKNLGPLTEEDSSVLLQKRVCVVGYGGLGGFCMEELARVGVGSLTVIDGDCFQPSNFNRQIGCTELSLRKKKAAAAAQRAFQINRSLPIQVFDVFLEEENAKTLLEGHDLILDALDSSSSRILLERHAEFLEIPLIHAAVGGWCGQVTTVFPGDGTLEKLYGRILEPVSQAGIIAATVAAIASLQVAEAIHTLLGCPQLHGILLRGDLRHMIFEKIRLFENQTPEPYPKE